MKNSEKRKKPSGKKMNKQHFRQKCNTTTSRSSISLSQKRKQQNQNRIGPFINYIYWIRGSVTKNIVLWFDYAISLLTT